jgi:carboxyl-terminal processing protease
MKDSGASRRWLRLAGPTVALFTATLAIGYGVANAGLASAGQDGVTRPPGCTKLVDGQPPPELKATTITTIEQAYYCVFDHYVNGPVLDSRTMLVPAFAALTQELQRRGLDQAVATLPALTGKKDTDWAAFGQEYQKILTKLPNDDAVRQALAEATMRGMLGSLNDNHVGWSHGVRHPAQYNIGLSGLKISGQVDPVASAPLYVTSVGKSSPAELAGVKAGDEVVAINDLPPYVNGVLSAGVLAWITNNPDGSPVKLTLHRPATNTTFTATVTAGPPAPPDLGTQSRVVKDGVGYVKLVGFSVDMVRDVLKSIAALRQQTQLREIIIDLRGNGGGDTEAVKLLVSSFVHDKTYEYWCNAHDKCTPNRTDDSVELLHLSLAVLTDRRCNSACDSFSATVKDLHLGTLIGTRTGGEASGPADTFILDDGSKVQLPAYHGLAANKEVINTIGVAPDYYAPLTAADLSAGRDPAVDKAASLPH